MSTGRNAISCPGSELLTDPAAREHVAKVWGISPDELPQPGYSAEEIMEAIHRGEIKALLSHVLQSARFAARCKLHTGSAGQA